jgi:hypothetical protein
MFRNKYLISENDRLRNLIADSKKQFGFLEEEIKELRSQERKVLREDVYVYERLNTENLNYYNENRELKEEIKKLGAKAYEKEELIADLKKSQVSTVTVETYAGNGDKTNTEVTTHTVPYVTSDET